MGLCNVVSSHNTVVWFRGKLSGENLYEAGFLSA
jgi:hypothetical protein